MKNQRAKTNTGTSDKKPKVKDQIVFTEYSEGKRTLNGVTFIVVYSMYHQYIGKIQRVEVGNGTYIFEILDDENEVIAKAKDLDLAKQVYLKNRDFLLTRADNKSLNKQKDFIDRKLEQNKQKGDFEEMEMDV